MNRSTQKINYENMSRIRTQKNYMFNLCTAKAESEFELFEMNGLISCNNYLLFLAFLSLSYPAEFLFPFFFLKWRPDH